MKTNKEKWHGAHHYSDKIHILFVIFLFLTVATLLFSYLGINKVDGLRKFKVVPQNTITPTPTPEFADWKIYSNAQYNFQFEAPSSYVNVGQIGIPLSGNRIIIQALSSPNYLPGSEAFSGFNISIIKNENNLSLSEYAKQEIEANIENENQPACDSPFRSSSITIGGQNSTLLSCDNTDYSKSEYIIPLPKANELLVISTYHTQDEILQRLLSTFKFTR